MTTGHIERLGDDLIIRLPHEAESSLGLQPGDTVVVSKAGSGAVSFAAPDADHQLRLERGRAFLRRYRHPA